MKYLDTFTGYGGFTLGIQRAYEKQRGIWEDGLSEKESLDVRDSADSKAIGRGQATCIGFSEIDKYAISVYQKHFPNHKPYGDITQINAAELPDFDLLTGGFPCQAFSIAGKRRGFDDTRGTLFFDIARILREKKPRWVLLENVKGLLSHDNGRTFKTIISTLVELGYGVEWQVLNAKNYGVPQNRERVFIVGNLGGERTGEVFPLGHADGVSEKVDSWQRQDVANSLKAKQGGPDADITLITHYGHKNKEAKESSIAPTLKAQSHGHEPMVRTGKEPNPEGGELQEVARIRRLTPIECERLMGLPDGWTARGKKEGKEVEISDSQRYKLCGNGVVVNVVEAVISKILSLPPLNR